MFERQINKKHLKILGEVSMQKVKVHRYVSGKRPEYAPMSSSEEESEEEDFIETRKHRKAPSPEPKAAESDDSLPDDPRLRRLKTRHLEDVKENEIEEGDNEIETKRRRFV